jgi:hypothetical protein
MYLNDVSFKLQMRPFMACRNGGFPRARALLGLFSAENEFQ